MNIMNSIIKKKGISEKRVGRGSDLASLTRGIGQDTSFAQNHPFAEDGVPLHSALITFAEGNNK